VIVPALCGQPNARPDERGHAMENILLARIEGATLRRGRAGEPPLPNNHSGGRPQAPTGPSSRSPMPMAPSKASRTPGTSPWWSRTIWA